MVNGTGNRVIVLNRRTLALVMPNPASNASRAAVILRAAWRISATSFLFVDIPASGSDAPGEARVRVTRRGFDNPSSNRASSTGNATR